MEVEHSTPLPLIKETRVINQKQEIYFILLLMLLFVLFRYYHFPNIHFILLLIASLFSLYKPIYGFVFYLFSISFKAYLLLIPGVTFSRYFGIFFMVIMIFTIFRNQNKLNKKLVYISLLILISETISSFYSLSISSFILQSSLHALEMGIFFGIVYLPEDNKRLIALTDLTCLFSLLLLSTIAYLSLKSGLFGYRVTISENFNQNQLAINLVFLCVIVFNFILLKAKKPIEVIIRSVIFLLGIIILFYTGSRSSMIGLIAGILFSLFYYFKKYSRGKKNIFIFLGIVMIFVLFIFNTGIFKTKEADFIANRYSYENFLNIENQMRYHIWKGYLENILPDYWLFGTGGARSATLYSARYDINAGGHNIIIALLVEFGLLGLIIFGYFYVITFLKSIKIIKQEYNILPFIASFVALIIVGIGENIFSQKVLWFSMAMCWRLFLNKKQRARKLVKANA